MKKVTYITNRPAAELLKVRCSLGLKERLARVAFTKEMGLSTVVREACQLYLAQHEPAAPAVR